MVKDLNNFPNILNQHYHLPSQNGHIKNFYDVSPKRLTCKNSSNSIVPSWFTSINSKTSWEKRFFTISYSHCCMMIELYHLHFPFIWYQPQTSESGNFLLCKNVKGRNQHLNASTVFGGAYRSKFRFCRVKLMRINHLRNLPNSLMSISPSPF